MARLVSPVWGAILSLFGGAAHAAPNAHLVYSRSSEASSCPDEAALRAEVAARIGYDPFSPSAERTVVASITKNRRAFVATVALMDGKGTHGAHELRTESTCRELFEAVALAIAIAIDPSRVFSAMPARPTTQEADEAGAEDPAVIEPDATEPAVTEVATTAAAPPSLSPPELPAMPIAPATPTGRVTVEGSVGLVASEGVAPSIAVGLLVGGAVRWRAISLGLEARVDAPAGKDVAAGGSFASWLAMGALVPCAHVGSLFACGVLQGGSMQASSSGVIDDRSTSLAWWAAGGRMGALLPLTGKVLFRPRGDVLVDLRPATLKLDGGEVWKAPLVSASFGADVVMRFR